MSHVLTNKSFQGHVGAQFFGAFNDNLFKQLILFLAARVLFPGEDQQGLAFAVFALPFILFSGIAGDLSERLSKRRIVVSMKVAELGIMLVGAVALQLVSWPLMLAVLFVMGAQSAFFGPAKYGVIPEIVASDRLLDANGIVTMTTFLAILLGQALAGPLLDGYGDALWVTGAWCAAFALVGIVLALRIRPLEAVAPATKVHLNPFGGVWKSIKTLGADDSRVIPLLFVNSLFWFNGGVLQQAITGIAAPQWLDIPADANWMISLMLVTLAVSIILGSIAVPLLARVFSRGKLVLAGVIGMVSMEWVIVGLSETLGAHPAGYVAVHAALAVLGFAGALFAVPVQTFLQSAPSPGMRGKAFAVNNFLNFTFIFLAGAWYLVAAMIDVAPALAAALAGSLHLGLVLFLRRTVLSMRDDTTEAAHTPLS